MKSEENISHLVTSSFLRPHGLQPTGLLRLWDFPDKNTGVGCHFLLQGIFPTQGSDLRLLLGRWILKHWTTWEALLKRLERFATCVLRISRDSRTGIKAGPEVAWESKELSLAWSLRVTESGAVRAPMSITWGLRGPTCPLCQRSAWASRSA